MTLLELLQLMRKHLKLVIALPIVCAVVAAVVSWGLLANEYSASVSVYVLTSASDSYGTDSVSSTDLSASQMLTNDVADLMTKSRVQNDAAEALGMDSLDEYTLDVESSTSTRVITLTVTGESATAVATVANQLAETTDDVAKEIMNVEAVNIIDEAAAPETPSGPSRGLYTAVAFLAGLFLAICIVVLLDMLNTRVRTPEEAAELLDLPVVGRIPAFKD